MPIGPLASDVFAEAVLLQIDRSIPSGLKAVRWVDDIVIGTNDEAQAHALWALLEEVLALRGLSLSTAKTRVVEAPALSAMVAPSGFHDLTSAWTYNQR